MFSRILFVVLSFCLACHEINGDSTDTFVVKNNLKRIINSALDALVNLEEKTSEITERANELTVQAADDVSSRRVEKKSFEEKEIDEENDGRLLSDEIKELQRILDAADKRAMEAEAEKSKMKRELRDESIDNKENENYIPKKALDKKLDEAKSREEKASVIIDNDSLRDLVDLVVRAINDEAKKERTEETASIEKENKKREVIFKERKDTSEDKEERKEITKEKVVTREMCNTRKRECIEKKDIKTSEVKNAKKSLDKKENIKSGLDGTKNVKKEKLMNEKREIHETKEENMNDSNEIREMVEEILSVKNEDEREAFASLLESVFERTRRNTDNESDEKSSKSKV